MLHACFQQSVYQYILLAPSKRSIVVQWGLSQCFAQPLRGTKGFPPGASLARGKEATPTGLKVLATGLIFRVMTDEDSWCALW